MEARDNATADTIVISVSFSNSLLTEQCSVKVQCLVLSHVLIFMSYCVSFPVLFIFSDKYGNYIKCLMPRNMCWDPVSNVAEVWCCSEHYLWLFDGGFIFGPIYCNVLL